MCGKCECDFFPVGRCRNLASEDSLEKVDFALVVNAEAEGSPRGIVNVKEGHVKEMFIVIFQAYLRGEASEGLFEQFTDLFEESYLSPLNC